jgi:hypothetical protein
LGKIAVGFRRADFPASAASYKKCDWVDEIETVNRHYSVSETSFLVFERFSTVGSVGVVSELCIGNDTEELCDGCFSYQSSLSPVAFAPDSRIRRIGDFAFLNSSLSCIVIPSNVESIEERCFMDCEQLSIVRFKSNSRLSVIGNFAFVLCPLETVWISSSIQRIAIEHFGYCPDVQIVIIETRVRVRPLPRYLVRDWVDLMNMNGLD